MAELLHAHAGVSMPDITLSVIWMIPASGLAAHQACQLMARRSPAHHAVSVTTMAVVAAPAPTKSSFALLRFTPTPAATVEDQSPLESRHSSETRPAAPATAISGVAGDEEKSSIHLAGGEPSTRRPRRPTSHPRHVFVANQHDDRHAERRRRRLAAPARCCPGDPSKRSPGEQTPEAISAVRSRPGTPAEIRRAARMPNWMTQDTCCGRYQQGSPQTSSSRSAKAQPW